MFQKDAKAVREAGEKSLCRYSVDKAGNLVAAFKKFSVMQETWFSG